MLWGAANGRCSFPNCPKKLVSEATIDDPRVMLGEMAHIVGESVDGPRGQSPLTQEERDSYENTILLCHEHHELVDGQPKTYTVEVLHGYKRAHEERCASPFGASALSVSAPTWTPVEETLHSTLLQVVQMLHRYRVETQGKTPQRVVIHKSSRFWDDEANGFRTALTGVREFDLVSVAANRDIRLLRQGNYPVLRGTHFTVGDIDFLYTSGFIHALDEFPHGHVPSPLRLADHRSGDIPVDELLREIMILTKLNWNSSDFCARDPNHARVGPRGRRGVARGAGLAGAARAIQVLRLRLGARSTSCREWTSFVN